MDIICTDVFQEAKDLSVYRDKSLPAKFLYLLAYLVAVYIFGAHGAWNELMSCSLTYDILWPHQNYIGTWNHTARKSQRVFFEDITVSWNRERDKCVLYSIVVVVYTMWQQLFIVREPRWEQKQARPKLTQKSFKIDVEETERKRCI